MFCNKCGAKVSESSPSCSSCGAALSARSPQTMAPSAPNAFCRNCGKQISALAAVCTSCGVATGAGAGDPLAKSKLVAGLLGIFLGGIGVHRFYLGYTGIGIAQIAVSILTCGAGSLWGLIEGILVLAGSVIVTDASGRRLKD